MPGILPTMSIGDALEVTGFDSLPDALPLKSLDSQLGGLNCFVSEPVRQFRAKS
jgi:hypothetical protein